MTQKIDSLQNFIFEHAEIRGELVYLRDTYTTIIQQRDYPVAIQRLLGEALVACALMVGSIKFEGEIQLQFQGDKRLSLLLVQCDHQLRLRACATYQENLDESDYHNAFMHGSMLLQIKQNQQVEPYQSIVPIRSTSMSENLAHYFAQSEQIASYIFLAVNEHAAGGMMLQLMPTQNTQQREQFWEYAVVVGETLSQDELLTLDNQTILHRLYHETEIRLFDAKPVCFQCRCTTEKMQQALSVLGKEDLQKLLDEQKNIAVTCDFCNQTYHYDAIDLHHIWN
jgi:molecular chaperone Hsp33